MEASFCRLVLLGLALVAVSCGAEPQAAPPTAATSAGAEPPGWGHGSDGMKVEGILGTIPQLRIEEVLEAKLPEFQRCFFAGSVQIAALGGHMKFYFHVGLDGRVEWVSPRGSSIGHRPTELCLLSRAANARFPAPKGGGPAEFVWGFELEPAEDVLNPAIPEFAVFDQRQSLSESGLAHRSTDQSRRNRERQHGVRLRRSNLSRRPRRKEADIPGPM